VKRFPFLDWMRGLAVVLMIQSHTFNSYTRPDLRQSGGYGLSQFVGGLAAPLFLFMAGMTLAFQMDSAARREKSPAKRWLSAVRRGLYVLGIAYLIRFTNCVAMLPHPDWSELTRVDILNCMGAAMLALSFLSVFEWKTRARLGVLAAAIVAASAPIVANLEWSWAPQIVYEYLAASKGPRGRFPLFPNAAYLAFGIAAGAVVRAAALERFDRLMQWSFLLGFGVLFAGYYFANAWFAVYAKTDFWSNSPALVAIRCGVALALMAGSFAWTEYAAWPGWSWVETLGKNSLMVYWVHVMLVYGDMIRGVKQTMTVPMSALATLTVTALMVVMSVVYLRWKAARAERWRLASSPAGKTGVGCTPVA
jgi:uncharacterized membrane protein